MSGENPSKYSANQPSENDWKELYRANPDYAYAMGVLATRQEGDDEFAGERNINDKTGKERTTSDFDLYPRLPGETPAEYGARLRHIHELTRDYEKKEAAAAAGLEAEDGSKTEPETEDASEAEEKAKREAEEQAKREAEIKAKLEQERLAALERQEAAVRENLARLEEHILSRPLVAVNADFTHDKRELAHDFAEQELNAEIADAKGIKGFVARIWKGNLFKKYFEKKYEREIYEGKREFTLNGERVDIDDVVDERSGSAIKRFVLGVTEEYDGMVHKDAGESLTEADAETTGAIKEIIEWFAGAEIPEGGSIADLRTEFGNRIGRLKAERRDDGKPVDEKLINNYYEVAMQARECAEHGIALERVMEGFKVYNADVRNNIRTAAHRDKLDRIVERLESGKIGQFIPAEVLAAAVGTAYSLTQTGARAAAGAGLGIGVSGVFAGLRERNRVTEDRARMMRDAAVGSTYSGTSGEEVEGGRIAKKRAKYEARIGGTLYDLRPATELTENLEAARKSENPEDLLRAIAEARVRVSYSDSESKDLISYSSADKLGDERLALDLALIRAEKSLSKEDSAKLETMKTAILDSITENVDDKDSRFRSERRKLVAKATAKTVALGATFFFGSQEIMAAFDPNKIGIFEKAGLLKTENAENAEETVLAGLISRGNYAIKNVAATEASRYEEAGFERVETQAAWTETKTDLVDVDPSASTNKVNAVYDGWANNGTKASDGNELRAYLENGQFRSGMFGNSTMGNQTFNYDELAAAGRIKGYITIGGAKFEVQGAMGPNGLTWGQNGIFTTTTGETIKAIGDNGEKLYKYFEIALDNGTDADGLTHIIPFATDVGRNTFSGTIQQVTETIVEHPAVYELVKVPVAPEIIEQTLRGVTTSGVVLPGATSRIGLGRVNGASGENMPDGIIDVYTTPGYDPGISTFVNPEGGRRSAANPDSNPDNASTTAAPEASVTTAGSTGEKPADGATESVAEGSTSADTLENAERRLAEHFGDDPEATLGEEGVAILTSNAAGTPELNQRISSWWSGLSDLTKRLVRTYEEKTRDAGSDYGSAFRSWLMMNPER